MPLSPNSQLGSYQILGPLGVGGMGEVYRARDSKLGRDVALKVLPEQVAQDRDRLARFTREAQLLASLNHPNIAAIYGVEDAGGSFALVLEYVDGETLAERINKGPIPIKDLLRFALQISQALEAAHEKTVVHRDLKPANVKITSEGMIKVLDFGLAKAMENEHGISPNLSQSPTISMAATNAGVILGTAGYMAPEQARGLAVDRRADIWAFGVVLFEMLTARRMFTGETVADTLAKVLEREPHWDQLPNQTPVALRKLLQRCLTKSPKERLQAIGEARILLAELIADPEAHAGVEAKRYPPWKKVLPWAVTALLLAGGLVLRSPADSADRGPSQFEQTLPSNLQLAHNHRRGLELSPDGRTMVFVGALNPSDPDGRIYVRSLDRWDTVEVPGTQKADTPFFSPDGKSIGFQQNQQIKTVALSGGEPRTVVSRLDNPGQGWGPPGISWGKNGKIVFSHSLGVGLSIVGESPGEVETFTTLDPSRNEASHRLPHFLPDGSAVLFTVLRYTTISPDWKRAEIWAKPMNGERHFVIDNAMDARYVGNNTLVFARQARLFAVGFDPKTLTVIGKPVQVLDNVVHSLYGEAAITWTGAGQFSVAENGTLLYASGSFEPTLLSTLVWYDHDGRNPRPVPGTNPMLHFVARVLPDGKRLAFGDLHVKKNIWIFDPDRGGNEEQATFEGQNAFPIFTPDGSSLAFRSDRSGPLAIYMAKVSNLREVTQLTPGPFDVPSSWTQDGKELAFTRGFSATGGNTDIYIVSVDNPKSIRPLIATEAAESFPEFSPDGKWIAYTSTRDNQTTLYVQPYPGPGPKVTIVSGPARTDGPTEPAWSRARNINELFYRSGTKIMSVKFKASGSEFIPQEAATLFDQRSLGAGTTVRASYDVSPNGGFLLNLPAADLNKDRLRIIFPPTIRLILNWNSEVRRLLDMEH